jgi:hypothetical protein
VISMLLSRITLVSIQMLRNFLELASDWNLCSLILRALLSGIREYFTVFERDFQVPGDLEIGLVVS